MNQDLVSEIIPDENTNPNIKSKSSLSIASSENSRPGLGRVTKPQLGPKMTPRNHLIPPI